jgi:two-component system, cell cycle response regulator
MTVAATSLGAGETTAVAPPDRRRLQIMIVEDSPGGARQTGEMLRRHQPSMRLTTCERIDDAARALADSGADCVLLDLGLPEADGLDGLNQILAVLPGVPVVVLSGVDDDSLALAAVSRGAQDYVTKLGLAPASLWRAINRAIERAHVTRELTHMATHDELTGLPNRTLFGNRIAQAIARSRRSASAFGVMVFGVDDFKPLNDNFGHAFGDAVLREIARRLVDALPDGDTACRYAGVEFAAICQVTDPAQATRVATQIHDAICGQPVVVGVRSLNIGISIGVALGSGEEDAATLMHRVDGAMYEARLIGAVCVVD